jgi:methyltransferase, UbiE/COQ5 family
MMLRGMNLGHNAMAVWCIDKCIKPQGNEDILDVGCGGGRNIAHFLKRTEGRVYGIDYSPESVKKSIEVNRHAIAQKRAEIYEANVSAIPFDDEMFDIVTAFETIYFWNNIDVAFRQVSRVLKTGGRFVVCNELASPKGNELWMKSLDMPIYTVEEIEQLMLANGFDTVESFRRHRLPHIAVIGTEKS